MRYLLALALLTQAPAEPTTLPHALRQIRSDARAVVYPRRLPGGGMETVLRAEHDFRITLGGRRVRIWVVIEPEPSGPVGF